MSWSGRSIAVLLVALIASCGAADAPAAPPPLRPKAIPVPPSEGNAAADCEPADPARGLPAKTFGQRSIDESEKLAAAAAARLRTSSSKEVDRATRERLMAEAVNDLITALYADPYNVAATYSLGAAYARIGRRQCSINLLVRLLQMRDHASRKEAVESKIDRLLGRRRTSLDPDFADLRSDARFRGLIAKMCEGSNDPACVFGAP